MNTAPRLANYTDDQLVISRSLDFARLASCRYLRGSDVGAAELFAQKYPRALSHDLVRKSAVDAGASSDGNWAAPLAGLAPVRDAFVTLVRASALIGRIPGTRTLPFNTTVPAQTSGGTYGWVGQGLAKPVSAAAFGLTSLGIAKAAGIIVVTEELMTLAMPGTEALLRDELTRGTAAFLDRQLIDPTVGATAINPASLTYGAVPIASAGPTAANARTDLGLLVTAFTSANADAEAPVLLLSPRNALALAMSGAFPHLLADGTGSIGGVPAITSSALGSNIVLLDARAVIVALDAIEVDTSRSGSVVMDSTPTDPASPAAIQQSLWQLGLVGLRVHANANWKLTRAGAAQIITGASY
jgi:hypothetical protein